MRRVLAGLIVLGAASAATAATLAGRESLTEAIAQEQERPGPDSARVAAFLGALRATDPVVCEMVSDQIGNSWWDDGAIGIGRLADSRATVRREKEIVSARVQDAAAIRLLAGELATEDPCVRLLAAKMLGNSTVTDDALARLFASPTARMREAGLRAASERDRLGLRPGVERLLQDSDAGVSTMAAFALGEYEQRASVEPLVRALRHASAPVRATAAWALGQIEDASVAADLEALLGRDSDRRVRLATIEALGNLDGLRAPPAALMRAAGDADRAIRVAALEALGDFDDEALAPVFLPHITDTDPHIRLLVIEALGEMRARSAVPAITRALRDPDPEVRRAAIEALAEIDDQ